MQMMQGKVWGTNTMEDTVFCWQTLYPFIEDKVWKLSWDEMNALVKECDEFVLDLWDTEKRPREIDSPTREDVEQLPIKAEERPYWLQGEIKISQKQWEEIVKPEQYTRVEDIPPEELSRLAKERMERRARKEQLARQIQKFLKGEE